MLRPVAAADPAPFSQIAPRIVGDLDFEVNSAMGGEPGGGCCPPPPPPGPLGVASQTLSCPSPSLSSWPALATSGQLSWPSGTPSPSPSPLPPPCVPFSRTVTLAEPWFATARSGLASPPKLPTA